MCVCVCVQDSVWMCAVCKCVCVCSVQEEMKIYIVCSGGGGALLYAGALREHPVEVLEGHVLLRVTDLGLIGAALAAVCGIGLL